MARPKKEINVERCKRLKQILDQTHTTQKCLSEKTNISQQAISAIVKKQANVTETTAKLVTDLFPQYSFEWLMGYADFKNNSEKFDAVIAKMQDEGSLLLHGLTAFAKLCDYQIELTSPAHKPNEGSASIEKWIKMVRDGYTIQKDGQTVNLSLEEMNLFENEVCDFVELKLKHLLKQKGGKNNG